MKTLDASDNNQTIQMTVATSFAMSLAENGTAGYKWTKPAFDGKILTLESDDTTAPAAGVAAGAGGTRTFAFRVSAAGTTKIDLDYRRSWEGATANASHYSVTIVAKD